MSMPLLLSLLQASYCKALGVCGRSQVPGLKAPSSAQPGCGLLNSPLYVYLGSRACRLPYIFSSLRLSVSFQRTRELNIGGS